MPTLPEDAAVLVGQRLSGLADGLPLFFLLVVLLLRGLPCPVLPQDTEWASSSLPTFDGIGIAFSRSLRATHSNANAGESLYEFWLVLTKLEDKSAR